MDTLKKYILSYILLFISILTFGQIQFQNPSFEQGSSTVLSSQADNWPFCNGSTDWEPGVFANYPPSDQAHYLGFWSGGASTYPNIPFTLGEGTMQQLIQNGVPCPLVAGKTYTFSFDLRSDQAGSYTPGHIAVVAGFSQCNPEHLFWDSQSIGHPLGTNRWYTYTITFTAPQAFTWIGFYVIGTVSNRHCSIDNLSTITKVDGTFATTNATCAAGGTITYTPPAVGGPFDFIWTDGAGNPLPYTTGTITDLPPGTYNVEVRDLSENCPVPTQESFTITKSPPFDGVATTSASLLCDVGTTAQFNFTPDRGGNFSYSWSPGSGLSSTSIANPILTNTGTTTTYTLTVTDQDDPTCVKTYNITVDQDIISAGTDGNPMTLCDSDPSFSLLSELNGTPDNGGTWTNPSGGSHSGTFDPSSDPSGTYTYTVTSPICPRKTATINITVNPNVDAGDGGDYTYCQSDGTINIGTLNTGTPTPGGTWTDVDGAGMNASLDLNLESVPPGVYRFEYTVTSAPPCLDATALVTIEVFEAPTLTYVSDICDATNTSYTVTMEMSGGDPGSYMINGQPASSPFTSAPQPNNSIYNFTLTDANGCAPLSFQQIDINGQVKCNCSTDAGTMQIPPNPITFCPGDEITINHNNNQSLDGNDVINYVIHTSNGNVLGVVLEEFPYANSYIIKHDGTFNLTPNITYYVSPIAGDELGSSGFVDQNDPNGCMSVSKGVPIIFLEEPEVNFTIDKTDYCEAEQAQITFTFPVGKAPFSVELSTGETLTGINNGNTHSLTNPGIGSHTISVVRVTDANGCTSTNNMPTASYNVVGAPTIDPNFTAFCNSTNTAYDIEFGVTGGDEASYDFSNSSHPVSQKSPGIYEVDDIGDNQSFTIDVNDGFNCASSSLTNSHDCPCGTQAGTMLPINPANPVEFCLEEVVSFTYDNATETLDGNDVVTFIICSDTANAIGTMIGTQQATPNFGVLSGTLATNTTYYVVALAGDDDGAGNVDFAGVGCFSKSIGVPFLLLDIPTVSIAAGPASVCQGSPVTLTTTTTGNYDIGYTVVVNPNPAGEGPYTFSTPAGSGETQTTLTGQTPGVYTFSVDTINFPIVSNKTPVGCKAKWVNASVSVTVEAAPQVALTVASHEICPGESVTLTFTRTGGNPDAISLTYVESATSATGTITIPAGVNTVTEIVTPTATNSTYTVQSYQTNGNSCAGVVGTEQVDVLIMTAPSADVVVDNSAICFGDAININIVNVTGNRPEYEVTLILPDGSTKTYTSSGGNFTGTDPEESVTGLAPGNYTVDVAQIQNTQISSASGVRCPAIPMSASASFVVNVLPDVDFSGVDQICAGEQDELNIRKLTGTNPITVEYTDNVTGSIRTETFSSQNTFYHFPTDTVIYTPIQVTDANGCVQTSFTTSHTVNVVQNPTVTFDADNHGDCPPLQTLLYSTSPNIRPGSILEWNVEGIGTVMNVDTIAINFEEQTTYDVSLKITTPEGCVSQLNKPDFLEVYRVPIPRFVFNPSVPNTIENLVLFQNQSLYAQTSEWYIDTTYLNNQRSPYHQFDSINGAFYQITLHVESAGGCKDSLTKRLQIEDAFDVYIPNSFTPDGDGRNETFGPVSFGIDTKGYSFAIYNRWGEQLFFSEVVGETWDGKYHGEFVPAGVYVYQVIVRAGTNATEKRYYGPVTVLR